MDLTPDRLDPTYAEELRARHEPRFIPEEDIARARERWMERLRSGDYGGPELDVTRYLSLRNKPVIGNPRQTE